MPPCTSVGGWEGRGGLLLGCMCEFVPPSIRCSPPAVLHLDEWKGGPGR